MNQQVDFQPGTPKELEGRRRGLKRPGPLSRENQDTVSRLVAALQALEEASDPRRSTPISGQSRYKRPSSEVDEGEATRWARNLERKLRATVLNLVGEVDARLDGSYRPPAPKEQVRCVYGRCQYYGKRIPKRVGPRGEIVLSHCQGCGKPLTAA